MPNPNSVNPKTGLRYGFEEEQRRKKAEAPETIQKQIGLLKRQKAAVEARDDFLTFIQFTMPDPEDPNDVERSAYKAARHHKATAKVLEKVEDGTYPFLIFCMPPRHGKSEQTSRRFPAWFIGRHPEQNVVVATYNDDFAGDFGKDVRNIMATPQYRQVFPDVKLQRGGAASDRLQTTKGGLMSFVGRGGSLTGRGAHCFPAGTKVATNIGEVPIEYLKDAPASVKVLSWDTQKGAVVESSVSAFASRQATRLFRITTSDGGVVTATGDHPFLTPRGFVEAGELASGDRLLRLLPEGNSAHGLRDHEAREARVGGVLLRAGVLVESGEQQTPRTEVVQDLRVGSTARHAEGQSDQHLLLGRLHGGTPGGCESRAARSVAGASVHGMPEGISPGPGADEVSREERHGADPVLLQRVQEPGAFPRHDGIEQSRLSAWIGADPVASARGKGVSAYATDYTGAGSSQLRHLPQRTGDACASLGAGADGQQVGEPDRLVQDVSHAAAREREVVRSVAECRVLRVDEVPVGAGGVEVFDIEVAGTHTFFAEGLACSNCLICDDLIKDAKEASSQAIRDQAWDWFTKVAMTRRMGRKLVIMTFTRWHSDDPIGRLTDPENEHYNEKLARKIKIINLPAIAEEDDPLGRAEGEPLWPEFYDLDFLDEQRSLDPLGFEALYQQRPSMLDGDLFKREDIKFYDKLPEDLRFYAASDHAVGTGQRNDPSCFGKVGIDKNDDIYILPELFWKRAPTDQAVEAMLAMCRGPTAPIRWWAERGHISKSIGPFLRKRMLETGTYINIAEVTPVADKAQRAQSIAARVAMGKVYFPRHATWTERAINEMMAFPNGTRDDFVDFIAWIGLGLQSQFRPGKNTQAEKAKEQPKFGTLAWVKLADKWAAEKRERAAAGGF